MFIDHTGIDAGEKMLWAQVLRRSVFDYVLYNGKREFSMEWKGAYQYIFMDGISCPNGYTFSEVCDLFGWDAAYLRRLSVKLTRDDIKKMEVSSFKEDFSYDSMEILSRKSETWAIGRFATPFLPLHRYSEEYRRYLEPKKVKKTSLLGHVPTVRWSVAA